MSDKVAFLPAAASTPTTGLDSEIGTPAATGTPKHFSHRRRELPRVTSHRLRILLSLILFLAAYETFRIVLTLESKSAQHTRSTVPLHATDVLNKCRLLEVKPGPAPDFHSRALNDRFVSGTHPTLIVVSRQA